LRAVSIHADVIVVTSRVWQTSATAIRAGDEAFLIDSPVYPDELEALATLLEQAKFDVRGLLATHADWDHLLGRLAFPAVSLGVGAPTARRLAAQPGAAQRELRDFDDRHYVKRARALTLGKLQELPVPGRCALGGRELELYAAPGHTADSIAIWAPWAGVLIAGDYLSPVEIPTLAPEAASLQAYSDTLLALEPLVAEAEWVVAGHGGALGSAAAAAILREDRTYLEALQRDHATAPLPRGKRSREQRRLHQANATVLGDHGI